MKCNEFTDRLYDYTKLNELPVEMNNHINKCVSCKAKADEYFAITNYLKPKQEIKVNKEISNNVIKNLKFKNNMIKKFSRIAAALILIAGLGMIFNYSNMSFVKAAGAAQTIFINSINAIKKINTLSIKLKIRTLENDNFEHIDKDAKFVEHQIYRDFTTEKKWKISKIGRSVFFNGENQFLLIKGMDFGIVGSVQSNFVGKLRSLVNPETIFEKEIENIKKCKDCFYEVDKTGNEITLTVISKARGNFENPYCKNSSFSEADTKTIYKFSKEDNLLQEIKLYLIEKKKETLILKTTKIEYNKPIDKELLDNNVPDDFEWKSASDLEPKATKYTNISSKQAATNFLNACSTGNWTEVKRVFPYINDELKKTLFEIEVLNIGASFKSGQYPGEFVPCKVKFNDGTKREFNLALRNDNKNKVWVIDGGL